MSILYRPVVKKQGDMYAIEPYSGNLNPQPFLNVGMDIHFGALFFVRFINGLVERYPELFEGDGHASQHAANFAKKWSSYSTINELANGDILKFNEVTEQPLEKCLLHLAYKADKAQVEGLMHKEMMKRVTP